MKQNKILFGVGILFVVGLIASSAFASSFGYNTNNKNMNMNNQNNFEMRDNHREIIQSAIDNNDYNAWKEEMTNNPRNSQMLNQINEDNFQMLIQMHNARENNDFETANKIALELGINRNMNKGNRQGRMHNFDGQNSRNRQHQNLENCPFN